MKVNLKKVMKKAHKLAKKMVGDYAARLALALRQVWKEVRNVVLPELKGTEKQVKWANDIRDIYIKNIPVVKQFITEAAESLDRAEDGAKIANGVDTFVQHLTDAAAWINGLKAISYEPNTAYSKIISKLKNSYVFLEQIPGEVYSMTFDKIMFEADRAAFNKTFEK